MNVALAGVRAVALSASAFLGLMVVAPTAWADTAITSRDKTEEQEMLAAARREAAERKAAPRFLEGSMSAPGVSNEGRKIVNIGEPAPAEKAALEAKRQEELQRLSDKIRRASAMRPAKQLAGVETPWTTEVTAAPTTDLKPESKSALGNRDAAVAAQQDDGRVTVLMVMAPGNRGIRRFDKSADPILCTMDGCYISNGSGTPSQFISLRRSFGFANTFGPRAGACSHQTACIFRGVDISADNAVLQPVDLRMMHHDRRELKAASADATCKVDAGRLSCGRPIRGENYTLWVVPERVAAKAGTEALMRAVEGGLGDPVAKASTFPITR